VHGGWFITHGMRKRGGRTRKHIIPGSSFLISGSFTGEPRNNSISRGEGLSSRPWGLSADETGSLNRIERGEKPNRSSSIGLRQQGECQRSRGLTGIGRKAKKSTANEEERGSS